MKVLITGAAGMLGGGLLRKLEGQAAFEVKGLTRANLDLRDQVSFERELREFRPDLVIHAAAKVGGIQANIAQPVDFLAANLQMDSNVITTCLASGVRNFIYIGSSCMYPKDYRQPLVETDILMAPLEPTNEGYAISKIAGSKLCEYASRSLDVNYKTLIPSNLYGPGDNFNPSSSHLLASVIRKVHEAKVAGLSEISVWGAGEARREFTYIEDVTDWIIGSMDQIATWPDRLNLGIGLDYSVNEFYAAALAELAVEARLTHDLTKPEGMKAKLMDSSLASQKYGWAPKTDIRSGIRKTYDWFIRQKEMEKA